MADLLCSVFLIAMSAAAIPPLVRVNPYVQKWMMEAKKPWICDLCMSFWSTVISTAAWCIVNETNPMAGTAAYVLTFAIVRKNSDPVSRPIVIPDLKDSSEE